jgi:two-component system, NarL family, nitrate/nitrite response regulator NarL
MNMRLRVALLAPDPARARSLAALVAASGHEVAAEAAELLLADVAALPPHEPPPALPIVVLGEARSEDGYAGVLPRSPTPRQLDAALRAAAAGLRVRPAAGWGEGGFRSAEEAAPVLTPREVEILAAIGLGLSNKETARRLGISVHTVKFHLEAAFRKLGATSRAEAVAKGLRRGLIEV